MLNETTTGIVLAGLVFFLILYLLYLINDLRKQQKRQAGHNPNDVSIAVLIDAENMPDWSYAQMERVAKRIGHIDICLAYADWSDPISQNWRKLVRQHAIDPVTVLPAISGKNAADLDLALDAAEILLQDNIDTFIILSSDTDYIPLYRRLKRYGKTIIVLGLPFTPAPAREAASEFIEILSPNGDEHYVKREPTDEDRRRAAVMCEADVELLIKSYNAVKGSDGWARANQIASTAENIQHNGISDAINTHKSFKRFILYTGLFETRQEENRLLIRRLANPQKIPQKIEADHIRGTD